VSAVGGRDPQRQDWWKRKQKYGFLPHCRCRMQMTGTKYGQTSIQVDGFNVKYIVGASNHGLLKDTLF
jgi:hypothetical protein